MSHSLKNHLHDGYSSNLYRHSVSQVMDFLLWGGQNYVVRFLAKIEHIPRKLLYFVSESRKIGRNFRKKNL